MSISPSELAVNAAIHLGMAKEAISSLEYTHNWEMQLQGHGAYQTLWGHGTYLFGLQIYAVKTLGYDITYSWGSAYASSKVFLGSGDDQVFGNIGSDKVHTGAGDDQLIGGDGDDIIYGDEGNDILYGGAGDDTLYAGTGTNSIYYGTKVFPRSGIGENYYGDGDDILIGGDGDDKLIDKGAGNNIFVGGKGFDIIHMGSGQNVVVIDQTIGEDYYSYDFITGFGADDVLSLKGLSGDETSLEEVKAKLGINWTELNGDTVLIALRENGPPEIIALLKNYIGLTLENFGINPPPVPTITFTTSTSVTPTVAQPPVEPKPQTSEPVTTKVEHTETDGKPVTKTKSVKITPESQTTDKVTTTVTLPKTQTFTDEQVFTLTLKKPAPSQPQKTKTDPASVTAIFGTDASDTISGTVGADLVRALKGKDLVRGGTGDDVIHGDEGNDNLYGDDGDDTLYGGAGNDNLRGGAGDDVLIGGDGDADIGFFLYSNLVSDAQSPVLTVDLNLKANGGRKFKKTPEGSNEEMTFHRFWVDLNNNGKKDDADEYDYYTGIENFFIRGGLGNDKITGAKGDDTLHGHRGNDTLKGKGGDDRLFGNEGNDVLRGGAGNDILVGGEGRDIMHGGKGDDTFYIGDLAADLKLADIVKDYGKGDDSLSFVTGTHTVYVKKSGKDTILQDGRGDDAEIYAILQGYTDPLTDEDSNGVTFVEIV
ncbi:MAG: Bifunctional hemolysin/adenylate cyclase [Alphaproteobacteria bacterium]|nr:MAG: Bifunctional hemolysin/adenylate cyclase [Alphaproteobacteria bacterium]